MATSGSINYSDLRNTILNDALLMIEAIGTGMTASSEDLSLANRVLNRMLKRWSIKNIHIWKNRTAVVYLEKGKRTYTLGGSSADHATETDVTTQIATAASSGATTLVVDSTTGMAAADNIGIQLDDGTLQWTTIVSVDSSTGLTITTALTDDVAVDNAVYTYTSNINKPLSIEHILRRDLSNRDTEVEKIGLNDYQQMPNKFEQGIPQQVYYKPNRLDGTLYVWHTPESADYRLEFTYSSSIEDMDGANDEFDLPSEWQDAVVANLALLLIPYFNKEEKTQLIGAIAQETLNEVMDWDVEKVSLKLQPDN